MADDPLSIDEGARAFDWGEKLHGYTYVAKLLLKRYWWIPLFGFSLGVAWQAWKVVQSRPSYVSEAKLMLSGFTVNPGTTAIQEQFGFWFGNQSFILSSGTVRAEAEKRVLAFNPEMRPSWVSVEARQLPDTAIIRVIARGDDSRYTRAYLDALIDEFINFRQRMKGETSDRALLAITEKLETLDRQITQQEDAVVEFRKRNNLMFIQEQGEAAGSNLAKLKTTQAELRTRLRLLQTLAQRPEGMEGDILGTDLGLFGKDEEASFAAARRNLDNLRAQFEEYSLYLKPRHPKIVALRGEIERSEAQIRVLREQARRQIAERVTQLQAQYANLEPVIAEQEAVALDNSRLAAEFERLNSNLTRSRGLYENLLRSIQTIETGQQIDPEIITVLERASSPAEQRASMADAILRGAFGGLLLGCGVLAAIGVIDSRLLSADDLKRRFNLPVLGIIPLEKAVGGKRMELLQPKDPRHLFAESCRTLRSSILFTSDKQTPTQVVLVTSSVPGEGKSTIASNLAIALSFTEVRVLLVDCDLRRGRLAAAFDKPIKPGMSDLLRQQKTLDEVVQHHPSWPNLDLIPAGEFPERPGELFLSEQMDRVMAGFREHYDYVVLDTAPILATDDTTGFCLKADSVVFVTRAAYTQARQVRTSLDRLLMRGARLNGFVLNCVDTRGTDYYYYKKYNDYYAQRS